MTIKVLSIHFHVTQHFGPKFRHGLTGGSTRTKMLRILPVNCKVPDDCIDFRRYSLFVAREVMRELIEQFKAQARGGK